MMNVLYLGDGDYSHYTVDYTTSLSISSYKSAIDYDDVFIAIAIDSNDNHHATVMCDYINRTGGGIIVNMMDPAPATFRLITWTTGAFSYTMGWSTMTLNEYIISYY